MFWVILLLALPNVPYHGLDFGQWKVLPSGGVLHSWKFLLICCDSIFRSIGVGIFSLEKDHVGLLGIKARCSLGDFSAVFLTVSSTFCTL